MNKLVHAFVWLVLFSCLLLVGCAPEQSKDVGARHPHHGPFRVRKDAKALTPQERQEFVQAVLKLKQAPSPYTPGLSYYDQFVVWHRSLYVCDPQGSMHAMGMGHGGPLFLPWHRMFVLLFENALSEVSGNPNIAVPYWDWTDPMSTAAVFQEDFMGGDGDPHAGYAVTSGPFRQGQWTVSIQPQRWSEQLSLWPHLVRRFGSFPRDATLPTAEEIREALSLPQYDVAPYDTSSDWRLSFRNYVEGFQDAPGQNSMPCGPDGYMVSLVLAPPRMHNVVHAWVGGIVDMFPDGRGSFGTMILSTSPNDPVFFLHHANVDRLWAEWQRRHGTYTYQPTTGFPGSNADDMMMPFHESHLMVTPNDVEDISELRYRYQ